MLKSLKSLFTKPEIDKAAQQHQLHLAAAALLIELSRADNKIDPAEQRTLEVVLHASLEISKEEIAELVELGGKAAAEATSLYEFTREINDNYELDQKLLLIQSMWRVAFADGDLDKYEERLIRQVSDLIHVPHSEFIRMKMVASGKL
jgi:uncharacterized tellurite resistance protein B-like protein